MYSESSYVQLRLLQSWRGGEGALLEVMVIPSAETSWLCSVAPIGTSVKIQTENVESMVLHQGSGNKPVTGMNIAETLIKKEELQELKVKPLSN